jgi:hypothetical protein
LWLAGGQIFLSLYSGTEFTALFIKAHRGFAAISAGQLGVLRKNLSAAMEGKTLTSVYDGYTSCPLVTGYGSCIMAEFDYDNNPLETFPFDQGVERRTMFHMKKDVMPQLYFNLMLR